ncbi:techylectin-5A [Caerostris darwini]|uniref:Techylectin-5A n=1 Tax=Caerostris darwini TaxID=1538125 RepID=A0AAV4QCI9_9ARAC|nr:techylectin-5A [Caerostris darwini]
MKRRAIYPVLFSNMKHFCFCGVICLILVAGIYAAEEKQSTCGKTEKALALFELAEELFFKAKELYPTCDNEVTPEERLLKTKSDNYLKYTRKFITEIKGNSSKKPADPNKQYDSLVTDPDVVPLNAESIAVGQRPKDCSEILATKYTKSGVYTIYPKSQQSKNESLNVYCDLDTDGGGWTVIQRRGFYPGKQYFNKGWSFYKKGFGNIATEFWLGNDNIYALTNQAPCEIRFDLEDHNGERRIAVYKTFSIDDEAGNYTIHISGYSGDAGDGMKFHDGQRFATEDRDRLNGARYLQGAWWINEWAYVHLNGRYIPGVDSPKSIHWYLWHKNIGLRGVEMKIRQVSS